MKKSNLLSLDLYVIFVLLVECLLEWMKIESEYLNILSHEKGIVTISDMEERESQILFVARRYYSIICRCNCKCSQ